MKQLIHLIAFCIIFSVFDARKIVIKSNPDRNADLFDDKDFTFSQDAKDTQKPTNYKGDPMKSKSVVNENVTGKKNFKFALGTNNGIQIEQVGRLKADNKTLVVKGSYSYTGADGRRYRVRYTADELGFHPITELEYDIPDITTKAPAPKNAYLPPNTYLPPRNTYLPPAGKAAPARRELPRDLQLPRN